MLVAVITRDGHMVGLYTSQVDAWQVAKPIGAVMWRCSPNSDQCVAIQRAMTPERRGAPTRAAAASFATLATRRIKTGSVPALPRVTPLDPHSPTARGPLTHP